VTAGEGRLSFGHLRPLIRYAAPEHEPLLPRSAIVLSDMPGSQSSVVQNLLLTARCSCGWTCTFNYEAGTDAEKELSHRWAHHRADAWQLVSN